MKDTTHAEYQILLTQLRDTLSDRTETAISARIELRDAVCRYVDAEQTRGTPLRQFHGKHVATAAEVS